VGEDGAPYPAGAKKAGAKGPADAMVEARKFWSFVRRKKRRRPRAWRVGEDGCGSVRSGEIGREGIDARADGGSEDVDPAGDI